MKERTNATLLSRHNIILKVCLFVGLYINAPAGQDDAIAWHPGQYPRDLLQDSNSKRRTQ